MRGVAAALAIVAATGCATTLHKQPAPAPRTPPAAGGRVTPGRAAIPNASAAADDVLNRTNAERRSKGLAALTKSLNLMRAAQIQAEQMASARRLDHNLPGTAYPTLSSRLDAVSYTMRAAGENIGEGYRDPAEAVSGWMSSAGHRANILSTRYAQTGTGVATARDGTVYWVQVFGRPR
jgi:uncharacterized protein YkwD